MDLTKTEVAELGASSPTVGSFTENMAVEAGEVEKIRTKLMDLLAQHEGCVSARMLRKASEKINVKNVEAAITRLRSPDQLAASEPRLYWRGRSFYTESSYLRVQEEALKEAEVAVDEQAPVVEAELLETSPRRRENRQEEARLVTYIRDTLDTLYAPTAGPDAEYAFDVHSDRPGNDYENVDLLAVHWRTAEFAELIAIEAKLDFTAKLVQQAANYQRFADRVWIAVPVDGEIQLAAATLRDENARLFEHVVALGIGILACKRGRGRAYEVQPIHWPKANKPDRIEREAFIERHRAHLEEAQVVPPQNRQAYPKL